MPGPALWLRWSGRDLRARWMLVVALALVIALATGMAAGLGSVQIWRDGSADASFGRLGFHDLRLALTEGSTVPAGSLERLAAAIPQADEVSAAQERLVVPAQVDASRDGSTVLVPGRLVGAPLGGPPVDATAITRGRGLEPRDAGRPVAVLEANFAEHYGLPARGVVRISGGRAVRYVGQGRQPEYFVVTTPGRGLRRRGQLRRPLHAPVERAGPVRHEGQGQRAGAPARAGRRRRGGRAQPPGGPRADAAGGRVHGHARIAGGRPPPHLHRREERPALHQRLRLAPAGGRRAGGVQPDQPGRRVAAPGDRRRHGARGPAAHPRRAPPAVRRGGRAPGRGTGRRSWAWASPCCCAR